MVMMSADTTPSSAAETEPASQHARHQPFAHLTAPNAELYRAIMGVFVAEKERFTVHLRPEDVSRLLPEGCYADSDDVAKSLDRLAEWGNLRPDPDTGRVTAVEDFYRRRYIYQLTRAGEAAEEALAAYDSALGKRGALQAVALADIAARLRELLAWTGPEAGEPDPALVHRALRDLAGRFGELADNARAFMGSLQRTIDLHDAEVEAFLAYKDRLIDYLERFIADLITTGSEIARRLAELESTGPAGERSVDLLLAAAAEREAVDSAPGADEAADSARRSALAEWHRRWEGLRGWFLSAPGHEPQAKLLRSAARSAIPQLLAVVAALNERRSGRSDRSADFRALARWFAEAPDDASRHRLWRAAFGLHSARHLTVDAETLQAREEEPEPAATPWAEARSVQISPQLRRTGQYERRGRPRKVTDRSAERRHLAEYARRQAEEVAAARARLDTGGEIRLSDIGELDPAAFRLFLGLLGDALAHWPPNARETSTTSNDGGLRIRLLTLGDGRTAEIRTPDGVFRGPDHRVEITDLEGGASA
ncbi:TIGR02677 family protein [Streptomonospora wellingtoniae]|uniref:TIGR02677 family protein n=1 Tax=Streptomonospora wellingtoniae TaxID=3075544 RepID=A0ABU2KZZ8_9ACTN|nr:TIGR02677 family protein [Streptomonospora sp. DSM 45055]MDT0304848.1 TIGR02677 family protein [Streptomonospora sp. DSM 45055]